MKDKIEQLEELKKRVSDLEHDDYCALDELLRRIALLIKHYFGESSSYIGDLKDIKFPEDLGLIEIGDDDEREYEWVIAEDKLRNLLGTMIEDLKMSGTSKVIQTKETRENKPKSNRIFIVHGTDHKPMKELKAMISGLGLNPIVLHEQPSSGKTVVEKLENYSDVGYAFVILTPDDGLFNLQETEKLLEEIDSKKIGNYHKERLYLDSFFKMLRKVARQNVILELGYFMGLLGRNKVCCLYTGNLVLPSDIHGIVYVPFKNSVEDAKDMIVKELRACGYKVDANKII
jgi:predicted nucleotide-binding protein